MPASVSVSVTQSTAPEVSVSAAPATITEGDSITLTFTADEAAPSGGLDVKYVIARREHAFGLPTLQTAVQTATIASGQTSVQVVHETVPDGQASASDATIRFRIENSVSAAGADYLIGTDQASVTVRQDTAAPTLSTATVSGTTLTLTYNEALDTGSAPGTGAFAVTVDGSARSVNGVAVSGSAVRLTLASAVTAGQTVTVSYTKPATNPIQDAAGNDAGNLSNRAVTDATPDTTAPALAAANPATVNGTLLTLTFNEALDAGSVPAASAFTVRVAGATRTVNSVAVAGSTVTLTLASAAVAGQTVTVSYTAPGTNPIQDAAGNDAGNLSNQAVTNATPDTTAPVLSTATVNGDALTLTYGEALDTGSVPAAGAFTVRVAGATRTVSSVSVAGSTVTLTLASAAVAGQTVTVSYTAPGTNPIQDAAGNGAAALTNQAATNVTPGIVLSVSTLTVAEGGNATYTVRLNTQPSGNVTVTVARTGSTDVSFDTSTASGVQTTLAFTTGNWSAAQTVTVSAAADTDTTDDSATLTHTASGGGYGSLTASLAVTVTDAGDTSVPTLSTATVNGSSLVLTYGEALDTAHDPGTGAFTVEADDTEIDVTGVSVAGSAVTLTLASAVVAGQTVEVTYTPPAAAADRLQDAAGNEAAALTDQAVTNNTPNNAPVLTEGATATRSVAENTAAGQDIGAVLAATDADGHTLTWSLGGTDAASFAIVSTSGQLQTSAALDHEAKASYTVTVTVSDGNGGEDSIAVTVNVTDASEPPDAPAAPTFGATTATTVVANWTAPTNTGRPAIDDYDVRYRIGTGAWTDHDFTGTGLTTMLTRLTPATSYEVQVRASNDEGDSGWSASGTVTTGANTVPAFGTATYTFTLAENDDGSTTAVAVGTVSATDADPGHTVAYSITAGNTGNVFAIDSSTGAITYTGSGEDHETTPSFSLTVRASDGIANTDATVTVNVTDVNEAPAFAGTTTSFDVAENTANVGSAAAADPDSADITVTYALSGTDHDLFSISAAGVITFDDAPDYEAPGCGTGDDSNTCTFTVTATAGAGTRAMSATRDITVTVTDANEAPAFAETSYSFDLAENADGSTTAVSVGTVSASDPDADDTVAYSIAASNTGDVFAISTTGAITYTGSGENHETTPSFSLTVRASDGTDNTDVTVTVNVTDVNEPPGKPSAPTFGTTTATTAVVNWLLPANTGPAITDYDVQYRQGTLAPWIDAGHDGTALTATLTGLTPDAGYEVQVRATNAEGTGDWSASGTVTAAANNAPTFAETSYSFTLAENDDGSTTAVAVGTVSASDVDPGQTVSYSITAGDAGGVFAISSAGAITYTGSGENHETTPSFTLTVQAGDGASGTATATVTVTVTDDDTEAPGAPAAPTFGATTATTAVVNWLLPANAGPAITDYDVQYREGTSGPWTDASHDGTGLTTTLTGLTPARSYQVQVRATNAEGTGDWSASGTVAAGANNAPAFDVASYSFTLAENDDGSTTAIAIGTVSASDVDPGHTVSYSITAGNTGNAFAIDSATGAITYTGSGADHETTPSIALTVQASDGAGGTATVTVTVTVTDVIEISTVTIAGVADAEVEENAAFASAAPTAAGNIGAVTWSLEGTDAALFAIDAATGVVSMIERSFEAPADADADNVYEATVKATDADGNTAIAPFAVTVTDVLESTDPPTVRNVAVIGPASGDTFGYGDTIEIQLQYNSRLTVTGRPRLVLTVGSATRYATFSRGDSLLGSLGGVAVVAFNYRVQLGDYDADGIAVTGLDLNGGTIRGRNDLSGDASLSLGAQAVAAGGHKVDARTDVATVAIASLPPEPPENNDTYSAGDTVLVGVTLGTRVHRVDVTGGAPRVALIVGDAIRDATYEGYSQLSGFTILTFDYEVQRGRPRRGRDIHPRRRHRPERRGAAGRGRQRARRSRWRTRRCRPTAGHKVEACPCAPDTTAPALSSATPPAVDRATLTLTYDEALDAASVPGPGAFAVKADGGPRAVSRVTVSGKTVTLTLGFGEVDGGQTVTVSYAVPGRNPIRDLAGNAAGALDRPRGAQRHE